MGKLNLPFKVGELIESRSFDEGYRGAWFRGTIMGLKKIKGSWHYDLKLQDFPDEEIVPEKIYQKRSTGNSKSNKNWHLMMRPPYPTIHRESQMPDPTAISDVVVIVDDEWQVGDLVDWFTTGCFWSGTITEVLGGEKVRIDLLPPPLGEGSSYEASCQDIRPSLDWSRELGWMVPNPTGTENRRCCARIMKPGNTGTTNIQSMAGVSHQDNASLSSTSASSLPAQGRSEQIAERPPSISVSESKDQQTAYSDSVSTSHIRDGATEIAATDGTEQREGGPSKKMRHDDDRGISLNSTPRDSLAAVVEIAATDGTEQREGRSSKKMRYDDDGGIPLNSMPCDSLDGAVEVAATDGTEQHEGRFSKKRRYGDDRGISLNSMPCDSLEATIADLEELVNRVKWLKGVLQFGEQSSTTQPTWEFLEHRASSMPK